MLLDWPTTGQQVSDTEALHLHGSRYIGLRTRYYDDLLESSARNGIEQVLLFGAGLDTRAYRLRLPSLCRIFELDQPQLLEWKDAVLARQSAAPICQRVAIGGDVSGDWPGELRHQRFEPDRPTTFVAEGLLPYLTSQEQRTLFDRLDKLAAPGSLLACDHITADPHAQARVHHLSQRSGIDMARLLATGGSEDAIEDLRDRGWHLHTETVTTIAARYGRDLNAPFPMGGEDASQAPPWLDTTFFTATR